MIVDVTKPEKPNLLKRTAESNQATSGNLEMVSPDVAIAAAPEKTPGTLTSSNHPTETVRVLDLSDPRNPKTLETFNKVPSILPDSTHSLIYSTNNEACGSSATITHPCWSRRRRNRLATQIRKSWPCRRTATRPGRDSQKT